MATFGENLRREREMRGVSLEEISAATKISSRFLGALEDEEFTKLPGGIFTRGFIRAYAEYLGLDEDHILAEYHLIAEPCSELDLGRLAQARPKVRRGRSHASLYAVLLAIGLLTAGYAVFRYSRRIAESPRVVRPTAPPLGSESGNSTSVPATETAAPASSPATASDAATGSAPGAAQTPATDYGFPVVESGLILQLAATERSWVAVDADDKTVLQRVLNPNEIQTLRAKNSFAVTLGNAQGVILTLNGETLKPLGRRGEVKSIRLTRDDLKKISP